MKILSITAQKPSSTGSGIYLTELVKEYARQGFCQAVVAGVYKDDPIELPDGVDFYPVYFESETALPDRRDVGRDALQKYAVLRYDGRDDGTV